MFASRVLEFQISEWCLALISVRVVRCFVLSPIFGGVCGKVKALREPDHLLPGKALDDFCTSQLRKLDRAHSPVVTFCLAGRIR